MYFSAFGSNSYAALIPWKSCLSMVIFSERPYVLSASFPFRPTISYWACLPVTARCPTSVASTKTRASLAVTFVFQGCITPALLYLISCVRLALGTVTRTCRHPPVAAISNRWRSMVPTAGTWVSRAQEAERRATTRVRETRNALVPITVAV